MKYQIGLIGYGNMGKAIIQGAVRNKYLEREEIVVYDHTEEHKQEATGEGFLTTDDVNVLCEESRIVLIAVKPQNIDQLLQEITYKNISCVLSVIAGVSTEYLRDHLNFVPVIRAMPNTPLIIGKGATALCRSSNVRADDYDFAFKLFGSMGKVASISEPLMDAIICVNGSTPAYLYYFIECILKDAVKNGIEEETAKELLVQTFLGSAALLQANPNRSLTDFMDEVCSKGGTTIEAIDEFRRQDLEKVVHEANKKCIARAKAIGK